MTIDFFTGFEGCVSTNDVRTLLHQSNGNAYSATGGWNNGKSMLSNGTSTAAYAGLRYVSPAITKTIVMGFHGHNLTKNAIGSNLRNALARLQNNISLNIFNTTSGLIVCNGTTPLTPYSEQVLTASIHHIEFFVYSHSSLGQIKVKVDGLEVISVSNINTGGSDFSYSLLGGSHVSSFTSRFDNWYISDQFEGELVSVLLRPLADVTTEFTPLTGIDNYEMINDAAIDYDSTYVHSGTLAAKDFYTYESLESGYTVKAASIITYARKDDSGVRFLEIIGKMDSIDYDLGNVVLTEAYPIVANSGSIITLGNALDLTNWDRTKFNSCKWGFKVSE